MNRLIIVPTQLILLFGVPAAHGRRDVPVFVLAADHEADLARGVGGDGGVGVFDRGEDFFAGFFEVGDEGEVEPLVLRCKKGGGRISLDSKRGERQRGRMWVYCVFSEQNCRRMRTDNLGS